MSFREIALHSAPNSIKAIEFLCPKYGNTVGEITEHQCQVMQHLVFVSIGSSFKCLAMILYDHLVKKKWR